MVALTGHRNVAHVHPGVRFATLVVNKSYRRHAVGRTTSVVAYVRQMIVNSHPVSASHLTFETAYCEMSSLSSFVNTVCFVAAFCNIVACLPLIAHGIILALYM